ncbi:V-type ATPase subunit [Aerococcus kribbianus]|uniref:V-type ATPase subunit n=1 Tax=Aerococcus kribbianus TaxID=2999064 RepID=A0A9X3FMC2_9LACT|nr:MULTISPECIES: V-type ATPase subunit [unclassified Aerococcus]MCZ0717025.1 V-type ATPase subunit [Aerococcus sp. YH-aer221]MCZ0725313.1 V-type ATPase subunit [Aerococcus sp. YH-aer222]
MSNDAAVKTKLKAMRSQMIKESDLDDVIAHNNLDDIYRYLMTNKSFQAAAKELNLKSSGREELEYLLEMSFFTDFLKLYRFSDLKTRQFLKLYIMTYEAHIIKRLFKNLSQKQTADLTLNQLSHFLEDKKHINMTELLMAKSISQGIACFDESIYAPFFANNAHLFQENDYNRYLFESSLDQFVAKKLWQGARKIFSVKDLREFKKFYGSEFDLLNINTIYRLKFYYHVDDSKILESLIPESYRVDDEICNQLINANSIREFNEIIQRIGYEEVFTNDNDLASLQGKQESYLTHLRKGIARQHSTTLFEMINYLDDKLAETRLITHKIEQVALKHYSPIERSFS